VAWLAKLVAYPAAITSVTQLPLRANIGQFPGWIVLLLWLGFYVALIVMGVLTMPKREVRHEKPDEDAQAKSQ
jgi:hypothetical protein